MKKATLKEIVDVMIKDATPSINFSDVKDCLGMGVYVAILPYIIPSHCMAESDNNPPECRSKSQRIADDIGNVIGTATMVVQAAIYTKHPEYLPILAGTNIISGIYEWGRNAKKRAEKR